MLAVALATPDAWLPAWVVLGAEALVCMLELAAAAVELLGATDALAAALALARTTSQSHGNANRRGSLAQPPIRPQLEASTRMPPCATVGSAMDAVCTRSSSNRSTNEAATER